MISILALDSLVSGGTKSREVERPAQYSHIIDAIGGYKSAMFSQAASIATMDDWIADGIGRHIQVYNDALVPCWEGFVNQIDAVYGNLTVTVGPLLDATNRLDVTYSFVDVDPFPPTEGIQANTGWTDDLLSQARYGVLPSVLSAGDTTPADATAIRDTYLVQHRLPATTQVWSTGGGATPSLTVHCLGYFQWLFYVYNQLVNKGDINTDLKIIDILTGTDAALIPPAPYNLNSSWLPFNTVHVDTPAAPVAVPRYEYENRTAWELIEGLTARGDANQNRWLFGIYDKRQAWYHQAPTTVEYEIELSDPAQRIMAPVEVKPWDVRPGRWALFTDFLIGRSVPTSLEEDPRAMFIESVTYTMPNTVALNGGKDQELAQIMASFGLGGVGV